MKNKHTKDQILNSALKYRSKKEWIKNERSFYQAARRHNLIDLCTAHMVRPPSMKKWTEENIHKTIQSCKDSRDFKLKYPTLYVYLSKQKTLKNYLSLIPKTSLKKYSDEECRLIINNFNSIKQLRAENKSFYDYLINSKRHAILNQIQRLKLPNRTLDFQYCKTTAEKYSNYQDFRTKENSVYLTAQRGGYLGEISAHMEKSITSSFELDFESWIANELIFTYQKQVRIQQENLKDKRFGFVYDFLLNSSIFIECNGLYWHSETHKKEKKYHILKREYVDLPCIQIYSDEWEFKQPIVKSIIKAKLGVSANKYQARKLEIKEVPSQEAQSFLKENHLMGEYRSAKHLGLYAQETLVSLLSYKKHRGGIDIARFCNKLDTSVAGGLSRLLKEVERREQPPFIQSWVDLRYGSGESLTKLGFKHLRTTLGWKWTDGVNTYNRLKCRANMDSRRLTEKQQAQELGWVKIYDAGQALFVKNLQ